MKAIGNRRDLKARQSRLRLFRFALTVFCLLFFTFETFAQTIEVTNNQPFAVRMPLEIHVANLPNGIFQTTEGKAVQGEPESKNLFFIADLPASATRDYHLEKIDKPIKQNQKLFASATENGITVYLGGYQPAELSFEIIYRDSRPEELKGEPYSTKTDFAKDFQPLPIYFRKVASGAVFEVWRGATLERGLQLVVELRVFYDGFVDINSKLQNIAAEKTENVYAAIVTRWQQRYSLNPGEKFERSVCYDNRIASLGANDSTNFRVGESRNWYVQRGVDWLKTNFGKNLSVAWMNDFSPEFTVHQEATKKHPARYVGANIPQIGYEAQTGGGDVYLLTEIARSNLKSYAERLEDNRLMPKGESISFTSRLAISEKPLTDEQVDNMFVAYASYAEQKQTGDKIQYSLGVPFTKFGTNYFPYSTLGENFDVKKLPGMDRDAYWAFAADTVNKWQLFADDIRRDLRIAKTLGFELIRLHHLEIIQGVDKAKQIEYLDFLFGEMRKLKLKVLIDARISAEDTAELVKRYRDLIDGVEVDNEVLIFGINDDAPAYWTRVYNAVKAVAPEIPVHLTAHTNTGAFDRLQKLGVPFDKIGLHAYTDGLDSMPNTRGFSLAAASYGRRVGKPPIITEWNWRFLTRMTEEERARVYAPIFENVLKTRSMPTMYQFQFNETLAMNPKSLKGIRHYEQLWLSRRPKPEAFVLSNLIDKYAAPTHPNRLVNVEHAVVGLDKNGRGTAQFKITNTSGRNLNLKTSIEFPANLRANFANAKNANLRLKSNAATTVNVALQALPTDNSPAPLPGFYHVFLRLEGDKDLLRYGWAEARLAGTLPFDAATKTGVVYGENAAAFDLNRPLAVVYGDKSPVQDVETAYALVNAVESAIGRPVKIYELKDLPKDERAALILVGTAKTNQLIAAADAKIPANIKSAKQFVARVTSENGGDSLVISGAESLDSERAAMDWLLRFWTKAKDSGARRVGLAEKELPLGFDPTQLP